MPCYDSASGGKNLLAILSEAFYKWTPNMKETQSVISKPPSTTSKHPNQPDAHIFYPATSAHLSQSDFGVLFPWVTTRVFGAKDPERLLRLNARAILQVLRESGVPVSNTSAKDLELEDATWTEQGSTQDTDDLEQNQRQRSWLDQCGSRDRGRPRFGTFGPSGGSNLRRYA